MIFWRRATRPAVKQRIRNNNYAQSEKKKKFEVTPFKVTGCPQDVSRPSDAAHSD